MNLLVKDPIYQQLNQALRALLGSEFKAGDQFLTERQIGQRFEVSRATANKALSNLVSEGRLEFRKGVGTFVRGGDVLDYDLRSLVSFTDKARAAGKSPATRVLSLENIRGETAGPEVCRELAVDAREPLVAVARLRLADESPVILERRHVVAARGPKLSRAEWAGSLYAAWTEKGLSIAGARQTIRAVNLAAEDARLLGARRGAAALLVLSTGYLTGDLPLWHEQTLYRAEVYEFHNALGGIRAARPAIGAFQ
jgi:GntR family transcriptional regulator